MKDHLKNLFGNNYYYDLAPLSGYFYDCNGNIWPAINDSGSKFYSKDELNEIIYHWFKNDLTSTAGELNKTRFDKLMIEYARFVKESCGSNGDNYHWDPYIFTPNYYLLNLIRR